MLTRDFLESLDAISAKDEASIASIILVSRYSEESLKDLSFPRFTDHSINHLMRVLRICNSILLENRKLGLLNEEERYILTCSILLHDIGLQFEKAIGEQELRRRDHHILSAQLIERDYVKMGVRYDCVDIIARIAEAHRGEFEKLSEATPFGTLSSVRERLLACLLLVADELDVSNERVSATRFSQQDFDAEASMHFYKHYFVEGIAIGDDRNVRISFRFPVGRMGQYETIFVPLVMSKLEEALNQVRPILTDRHDIFLSLSRPVLNENTSVEAIPPSEFERIVALTKGVRSFEFLTKERLSEYSGVAIPEQFYTGQVGWPDILADLDIGRQQYPEIRDKFEGLFSFAKSTHSVTAMLICGEGGSGKSTCLRRLAFDLCQDINPAECNLLWLLSDSEMSFNELKKLYHTTQRPTVVFVDGFRIDSTISALASKQYSEKDRTTFPIVLVFAARANEWANAGGHNLRFEKFREVQLERLTRLEMQQLLLKLEQYDQLYSLKEMSAGDRLKALESKSDRQLLVAMLEATRGKGFKDIILDEYQNIRRQYYQAASAYELVSLFYCYSVLVPEELIITFVNCRDVADFYERVVRFTRLVIVRHYDTKFGRKYQCRHIEIARVLIEHLEQYKTFFDRLQQLSIAVRNIDVDERRQRYVVLEFLRNFIKDEIKRAPSAQFDELIDGMREYLQSERRLQKFQERAHQGGFIAELKLWSGIYRECRMPAEQIAVLRMMVSIDRYDPRANWSLAQELRRMPFDQQDLKEIADFYVQSFSGGNTSVKFLLEFVEYCVKNWLYDHLDKVADAIGDFISSSSEEVDVLAKIGALLQGYKINRNREAMVSDFAMITANLAVTKELSPSDQLYYIDNVERGNPERQLESYLTYLQTTSPNRPPGVVLRIARVAARVYGKTSIAVSHYEEYVSNEIEGNPNAEHFGILMDYARLRVDRRVTPKERTYQLLSLCKMLRQFDLRIYELFSRFADSQGDLSIARARAKEGLEEAAKIGRLDDLACRTLRRYT